MLDKCHNMHYCMHDEIFGRAQRYQKFWLIQTLDFSTWPKGFGKLRLDCIFNLVEILRLIPPHFVSIDRSKRRFFVDNLAVR
jgi:hypothetical protein